MARSDFVFEVFMDEWPEWEGNELYATKELAQFFGIQDFENTFYDQWKAGFDEAKEPGEFHWMSISKGYYHLYEDGVSTGVSLRFRFVHNGGSKP